MVRKTCAGGAAPWHAARFAGLLPASLSSRRRERRDDYEVNIPASCSEP